MALVLRGSRSLIRIVWRARCWFNDSSGRWNREDGSSSLPSKISCNLTPFRDVLFFLSGFRFLLLREEAAVYLHRMVEFLPLAAGEKKTDFCE